MARGAGGAAFAGKARGALMRIYKPSAIGAVRTYSSAHLGIIQYSTQVADFPQQKALIPQTRKAADRTEGCLWGLSSYWGFTACL